VWNGFKLGLPKGAAGLSRNPELSFGVARILQQQQARAATALHHCGVDRCGPEAKRLTQLIHSGQREAALFKPLFRSGSGGSLCLWGDAGAWQPLNLVDLQLCSGEAAAVDRLQAWDPSTPGSVTLPSQPLRRWLVWDAVASGQTWPIVRHDLLALGWVRRSVLR